MTGVIPDACGTYALLLRCTVVRRVPIGRLGPLRLRPGWYVYVGSAFGAGGLRARIRHHRRIAARPHWHIDYLRRHTRLAGVWYIAWVPCEHDWAELLGRAPGAEIPVRRFGSSDCRCPAHLFRFERLAAVAARSSGEGDAYDVPHVYQSAAKIAFNWEGNMESAKKGVQKSPKRAAATGMKPKGFTDEEQLAMRERLQELKAAARRGPRAGGADGESAVLAKIAALPQPERAMAERLHVIIKANGPELSPRTWYGMPAYAKDGNVVCFFQSAHKFKTRYATLGFSDKARFDEGNMWPTAFALRELTETEEARIGDLVKKAVS